MRAALFAALAIVGAALLAVAEFTTLYDVVLGPLEVVRRTVTGGDSHSYALLILAGAALPMVLAARRGARSAALALALLGAAALVVALAVDLPDTRASGQLPESVAFEDAHARAGVGLYLELGGGALLVLAGAGLAVRPAPPSARAERAPA